MPRMVTCDGCGGQARVRAVVKAALCPACLAAVQGAATDPPDFSGVGQELLRFGKITNVGDWGAARSGLGTRVSAVVPMFNGERHVRRCLRSLIEHLPAGSEIIAVDDASPDLSGDFAARELAHLEGGLVVRLEANCGFARAVNVGAGLATGRYFLPFNVDAQARPGFAGPMIEILDRDAKVAVVGNRHVKPDGKVDSEGSEFLWHGGPHTRGEAGNYQHVGRNVPDPLPGAGEKDRDVVTFACVMVRASAWRELGGLDERYRRGYWEDADFCLRARAAGRRVLYTARSEIVHLGQHSGIGGHAWYERNRALFRSRWVTTGLVDRFARERGLRCHRGRVVVCMIACAEEELVAAAIESVYPLADEIVVVEGGNRFAVEAGLADENGRSTDGTLAEIASVPDPEGKILGLAPPGRPWRDKREQRNRYLTRVRPGDWMLLLDADEVFSEAGLWRLSALMHGNDVVMPGFWLHWNDPDTLATGKWDDYWQVKAVRWREEWSYDRDHNMPTDAAGRRIMDLPDVRVVRTQERLYHHYSWCMKPEAKLRAKAAYYLNQNRGQHRERFASDWFDRVFLAWRRGGLMDRDRIERLRGTHPYGGGGAARFTGEHPEAVRRRLDVHHGDTEKPAKKVTA